jgi:hypothetical protein
MNDKELGDVEEKFEVLVALLHQIRNTRGEVNGRGLSVAITHVETAHLWFADATKDITNA